MSLSKIESARIASVVSDYAEAMAKHSPAVAEYLPVLRTLKPTRLLASNAKLDKAANLDGRPIMPTLLTLAPAMVSGKNMCPNSGECASVCNMLYSGLRIQRGPRARSIWNTLWFLADRGSFIEYLHAEIDRHYRRARKLDAWAAYRLNGASDLWWVPVIEQHGQAGKLFYDYTKVHAYIVKMLKGASFPRNYWFTYSADERSEPERIASYLWSGVNVAQVVDVVYRPGGRKPVIGEHPRSLQYAGERFPCFNADKHDVRVPMLDGIGRVGTLAMKGASNATKVQGIATGFARAVTPEDYQPALIRYA